MKKISMIFILLITGLGVSACSVNMNEKQQETLEAEEAEMQNAEKAVERETSAGAKRTTETETSAGTEKTTETEVDVGTERTTETGASAGTENTVGLGGSQQISGYELVDGDSVPVTVTFTLKQLLRGEEAYQKLTEEKAGLAEAPEGMEYVVADIQVSYDEGEAESLYLAKNEASLPSAKLYFALSNGDSNGEDLTDSVADSIYNLELQKGETGEGTVVFLHSKDSDEPLYFTGFDNIVKFNIKK